VRGSECRPRRDARGDDAGVPARGRNPSPWSSINGANAGHMRRRSPQNVGGRGGPAP
jgi:hypothetical protein